MKRFALVVVVGLAGLAGCLKEPSPTAPPAVAPEAPHAHAHAHEGVPNAAPAAPAPAAPAAPPAPPAPGTTVQRLGAPITETQTVSLADLRSNPARFAGRTIRTEGVVAAVCQAAGCWMQLADEAGRAHIRMHGHAFFVPRNASGRRAAVQATVVPANPNGHCEQEAAEQTGQVARLELDATGVELY
jgi:hypothetical protein